MKKVIYIKNQPHKRKKRLVIISLFFIVTILIGISFTLLYSDSSNQKKVQASEISLPTVTPVPTIYNDVLKQTVENSLRGTKGSYGIVIKNLDTNEDYSFNEHIDYDTASLYKLWVMSAVYKEIQEGSLNESTILSADIATLNNKFNLSDDQAELSDGVITLSVKDALTRMITVSDNYSAMLLTQKIGLNYIASYLTNNGFFETTIGTTTSDLPTTTAYDVALFYEKLVGRKLANEKYTNEMLDLLKNQQRNNKIPKYLPTGTIIAHKTGELDDYSHDAGLILDKKGTYIIVILSKNELPDVANETISDISKAVYEHYITSH